MNKTYHASSLEQIAVMFDDNAKRDKEAAGRTPIKKQASKLNSSANAWETAAAILRDTELHIVEG